MTSTIELIDRGRPISFSFADVERYHGPGSPGGAALAFKALERALPLLDPSAPCERREIVVETAFRGPGARDAFELVTRAVTGERFHIDAALERPERGRVLERFVFRLTYRQRRVTLMLRDGFVSEELIDLARTAQRTSAEERRLDELKRELADRVLARAASDIYELDADPGGEATPRRNRLQAIVFDVDGTLVESERDGHRVAFNRAFEEAGLPDRWDVERYGELLEVTGGERRINAYLQGRGMAEEERRRMASRLHVRKTEIFTEMVSRGEIEPRPGVAELLDQLAGAGVRLAVATTGTGAWVHPLLERLFGSERFEVVVTGDEAPQRKPDPSAYRQTLESLSLPSGSVVAIEDSLNGLRAAKSAGLACVIVVNDYTRDQDFTDADLVLDGFGAADARCRVLSDPHGLNPSGRLDIDVLRGLAAVC